MERTNFYYRLGALVGTLGLALFGLGLFGFMAQGACGAIPVNYYDAVDDSTSATLRSTLHAVVSTNTLVVPFSNSTNSFAALARISRDHADPRYVRLFYSDDTRPIDPNSAVTNGTPASGGWSREHSWPQSFYSNADPMVSDLHMLLPADADLNNQRGSKPYNNVPTATYTDIFGNRASTTAFEPRDSMKGDAARAIFYMDVRYENAPNLSVDDGGGYNTGGNRMGFLSTLLAWHALDPPDAFEVSRNQRAYAEQGNANPFIDHPEWVAVLYGVPQGTVGDGDSLTTFTAQSLASGPLSQGVRRVPMLQLALSAQGAEFDLGEVDVQLLGTVQDSDVAAVELWLDRDASGDVSRGDTLLAAAPTSGGLTVLIPTAPQRLKATTQTLLLTASVAPAASTTATLGLRLVSNGLRHDARGGSDVDPLFGNQDSDIVALSEAEALGVNIVAVSTRASSNSAAMEYIVLANHSDEPVDLTGWELRSRAGINDSRVGLSGVIQPFSHFVIVADYPNLNDVEGVAGDLRVASFFGNMADNTGRSIALYDGTNGLANKVDGFSFNGGGTNDTLLKDGNAFTGSIATATLARRQVYSRKRHAGVSAKYQDTDDNANDLQVESLAAVTGDPKPPASDYVPVELSLLAID